MFRRFRRRQGVRWVVGRLSCLSLVEPYSLREAADTLQLVSSNSSDDAIIDVDVCEDSKLVVFVPQVMFVLSLVVGAAPFKKKWQAERHR